MATQQYYLKDKTLDIWKGEQRTIYGVPTTTYSLLYSGLYCYYRQQQGGTTLEGSAIKIYDSTERAIFVINRMPSLRSENLAMLKIKFNGRVYDLKLIDDFEGYTTDYKITAEYSSSQTYPGMT